MREIKFRAWDKEMDFMISVEKYKIDFIGQVFFDNDDRNLYNQTDKLGLMQYTGLKDKNLEKQKEVYEYDILEFRSDKRGVVEWDYKDTGWCVILPNFKKLPLVACLLQGALVVGNKFENEDLLK